MYWKNDFSLLIKNRLHLKVQYADHRRSLSFTNLSNDQNTKRNQDLHNIIH